MKKYKDCFKEQLSPTDRIKVPAVRIRLDPSKNVSPRAHTRPYDTPYHLREAFDTELREALEAGILSPAHGCTNCFQCPSQASQGRCVWFLIFAA